jgi:hypothetical protein
MTEAGASVVLLALSVELLVAQLDVSVFHQEAPREQMVVDTLVLPVVVMVVGEEEPVSRVLLLRRHVHIPHRNLHDLDSVLHNRGSA